MLRCPATDWQITGKEEKNTPAAFSARIHAWVKAGALIRCDGEASATVNESLLDTPHKGMNRAGLVDFVAEINAKDPDAEIETDGVNVADLKDAIQEWKDAQTTDDDSE